MHVLMCLIQILWLPLVLQMENRSLISIQSLLMKQEPVLVTVLLFQVMYMLPAE